MEAAKVRRTGDGLSVLLAGLQAGMLGVLWMLAWMGFSAGLQRRSFWTPENLMATTFYEGGGIGRGFSGRTLSGLALYILVYAILGAVFALTVRGRFSRGRLVLVGLVAALAWYYVSFHGLWKAVSPLVALLHPERPTIFGHVIYGFILARFPRYLRELPPEPAPPLPAPANVSESEPPVTP